MSITTDVPDQPLHPVLADLYRQTGRITADVQELVSGLNDNQFNWRPGPKRWSIGECMGHLNTGESALPLIDRLIEQARGRGLLGQAPYRTYWFGRFFINITEPRIASRSRRSLQ